MSDNSELLTQIALRRIEDNQRQMTLALERMTSVLEKVVDNQKLITDNQAAAFAAASVDADGIASHVISIDLKNSGMGDNGVAETIELLLNDMKERRLNAAEKAIR